MQKAGLHLDTNGASQSSQSVTAPPSLQPFFDDMSDSKSQSSFSSLKVTSARPALPSSHISFHPVSLLTLTNFLSSFLFIPSGQKEEVCLPYDWHTLFTPPSPKPNTSPPSQRSKVCPSPCLCVHLGFSVAIFFISTLCRTCERNQCFCQIHFGYPNRQESMRCKKKKKKKVYVSCDPWSLKMYDCF